ncbi:MAG: hypothetical protein R6U86_09485 [Bacteroidales bacterium]
MEQGLLEWIGYIASAIIALSMTMSSIVKFRLINLAGAALFSVYGLLIGALPVAFLNGFIVAVDLYYLYGIFSKKEVFETLEVRSDNRYMLRFLKFYRKDIQRFFPAFSYEPEKNTVSFFVLRDMAVAGLFLAHRTKDHVLQVDLDYVIPEFRDFKNGKFVYHRLRQKFSGAGYHTVVTHGHSPRHQRYLRKLGFVEQTDGTFQFRTET